jgi:hypothetical protein
LTFDDLEFGPRNSGLSGVQAIVFFDNGYGASVIKGTGSYGVDDDLYELGVVKADGDSWDLCYTTEITNDVIGYLSEEEITNLLQEIEAL